MAGFPDTDPSGPASAYSDAVAGMAGAQAVLLALIHRARTGQGQWIDLSQYEALSSQMETLMLELSVNKQRPQRAGNRLPHGGGAPHGVYRCKGEDRWVAIAVFTDSQWHAFADALGNPRWTTDQLFTTALARSRHSDELDSLVESWTLQRSSQEVMCLLQAVGVCAGVVQTGADLAERDPQLKERGFFRQVLDADGVIRTIEGSPYKLSRTPGGANRGAPAFGSHQTYVLRDVLGMSDDELADCAIAGVFE
ncbi:MAG: CaiB/BaiF CoA transferase family protein [Dehalococcoidia bacterium]